MIRTRDTGKPSKIGPGSGRRQGKPTGKAEGRVTHLIINKKTNKAARGSQGPQNKFGMLGGQTYANPATSGAPMTGADMFQLPGLGGKAPQMGGDVAPAPNGDEHWHRAMDEEGNPESTITRGPAPLDQEVEHIFNLGPEHVAVGFIVEYETMDGQKGEALIEDWGKRGILGVDGEGQEVNIFWNEVVGIEDPMKAEGENGSANRA